MTFWDRLEATQDASNELPYVRTRSWTGDNSVVGVRRAVCEGVLVVLRGTEARRRVSESAGPIGDGIESMMRSGFRGWFCWETGTDRPGVNEKRQGRMAGQLYVLNSRGIASERMVVRRDQGLFRDG